MRATRLDGACTVLARTGKGMRRAKAHGVRVFGAKSTPLGWCFVSLPLLSSLSFPFFSLFPQIYFPRPWSLLSLHTVRAFSLLLSTLNLHPPGARFLLSSRLPLASFYSSTLSDPFHRL